MHNHAATDWRAKYFRIRNRLKTTRKELEVTRAELVAAETARIKTAGQLQDLRRALLERVAAAYEIPIVILLGDTIEELEDHARYLKKIGY